MSVGVPIRRSGTICARRSCNSRHERLTAIERADDVHRQPPIDVGIRGADQRAVRPDPRVVHEDVNRPDLFGEAADTFPVGDIALVGITTRRLSRGLGLHAIDVDDGDAVTVVR